MEVLHTVLTGVALLANAVVYGTDFFSALVQRPAMAHANDEVLTSAMGLTHHYGDKRMPVPGVAGVIATALTLVAAVFAGGALAIASGAVALASLVIWLLIYNRISGPVNKKLGAAALAGVTLPDARELQKTWDSVINVRVVLQGLTLAALFTGVAFG
ncbi:DUF1772 domain-containing protein [Streptomyces sp. NPDC058734]|uniref:DUF1772 domain-containing protein n=1 Tax=Streptomyces sp. NPDC058734 TaxID=3346615 RepID=UPI00368C876F